jgi:hypothetical protein
MKSILAVAALSLALSACAVKPHTPAEQKKYDACKYEAHKHASGYDDISQSLSRVQIFNLCMKQGK